MCKKQKVASTQSISQPKGVWIIALIIKSDELQENPLKSSQFATLDYRNHVGRQSHNSSSSLNTDCLGTKINEIFGVFAAPAEVGMVSVENRPNRRSPKFWNRSRLKYRLSSLQKPSTIPIKCFCFTLPCLSFRRSRQTLTNPNQPRCAFLFIHFLIWRCDSNLCSRWSNAM